MLSFSHDPFHTIVKILYFVPSFIFCTLRRFASYTPSHFFCLISQMNIIFNSNNIDIMRRPGSPSIEHLRTSASYVQLNRKRQRRQVAGAVVQGLVGGAGAGNASGPPGLTPSGRKSTAQPRPKVQIPPRGIGPISEPNNNDGM